MKSVVGLLLAASLLALAPALHAQGDRAGEVTALLPTAHLERGSAPAAPVSLHDSVFWRDWLETEPKARARLALLDGSILNVGSDVRLQVARHDQASGRTQLELEFGKLRTEVQKAGRPAGEFEIRTKTAVVGVIGTHVYVEAAGSLSRVINFQGSVRVRNADRSVPGVETLEPFELAEVERGRPPRKRLATLAELLQAMEDTLPGALMQLVPQKARVGSCTSATTSTPLAAGDASQVIDQPFMQMQTRSCAVPELVPVRVCVPESAQPGVYEYAATAADGAKRWGAFLVQPKAPLQDARLLYSPELPPGASHYGRLVGKDDQPLPGVPLRVLKDGEEEMVFTDADGGFTVQAPESGKLRIVLDRGAAEPAEPLAEPLEPVEVDIQVVDKLEAASELPDFSQRGSVMNVPGEVKSARLGDRAVPVLRTVTRAGRTVSTVAIPSNAPEGPAPLELEQPGGERRQQDLLVYEILGARLDQRSLMTGGETQGEFLVCVGKPARNRKVRALMQATGPVQFRGKGSDGKKLERTFKVEENGLLRIPFQIQAEKGGPGAGIPFTLTLRLTRG